MFLFAYDVEIQVHWFVSICVSFPNVLGYLFFCAFGVGTFGGSGLGIGLSVWGLGFGDESKIGTIRMVIAFVGKNIELGYSV